MNGYKAFDEDLSCKGYRYEVGETYRHDGEISMCREGFHFCKRLVDCYIYYGESSRICEVKSGKNVVKGDDKCVTDKLTIVRELSREEVLASRNTGKDCTGIGNTGHCNTGDCNTGDRNSGDWNSGRWNSGDWNTGRWNSGHWNTGDWNITDSSSGVLCTEEPECLIFDKPSGMTLRDWRGTRACRLMGRIELKTTEWRCESDMTDQEKADHPDHGLMGGYLKEYENPQYDFAEWWDGLTDVDKETIKAIPNFDAVKWEKITGIKL